MIKGVVVAVYVVHSPTLSISLETRHSLPLALSLSKFLFRTMQQQRQLPVLLAVLLVPLLLLQANGHNITKLLATHPSLTSFNHYLSLTHLADDINSRTTITVLALDNSAMSSLLSSNPSLSTLRNILSLHVLLDYFGAKKLHQITNGTALAATLFQASGTAPGSSGFVNITDLQGGKVAFGPEENDGKLGVFFVKSVEEVPYNVSVIQVSGVLPSDVAAAPTPGPSQVNLTNIMSAHGCKFFADTLLNNSDAMKTYEDNVEGGLTVFCPLDDPFKQFLPKYRNLSATGKVSYLEFYAVPMYLSMAMLKSNNGLMNTLATDGANKYDFTVQNEGEQVNLKTKLNTVRITGTLLDEQPLAIYSTDKVLLPKELFRAEAPTSAPAPSPDTSAESPKASRGKSKSKSVPASADSPAYSPGSDDVADQTADGKNSGLRLGDARYGILVLLSFWICHLLH